jgi:HlyD family secretion protein
MSCSNGRKRWPLGVVLVLSACGAEQSPLPLVGTLERDRVEITAEAREMLMEIRVREGDRVTAGQVIAVQDDALARARHAAALAERERAHARLAELERGPRREDVAAAQAHLSGAGARLAGHEAEFRRIRLLVDRKLASAAELDAARADWRNAEAAVGEARAALDALEAGTTEEELAQARASLARTDADLDLAQAELERLTLKAPAPGLIDAVGYEAGDRPPAGAVVAVLLTGQAPYARTYVPQPLRALVAPGSAAMVHVDGVATPYSARVRYVASDPVFTPFFALTERDRSRLAYVAEVELLGPEAGQLPVGLPVEVDLPEIRDVRP